MSDAGDSQIWQLPDHRDSWCRTVHARAAGTSFDRSAFPQAFAHMERHKRKELSSSVMCQPAASGPRTPRARQVPRAVVADGAGWWGVSPCAPRHPLPNSTPRRTQRDKQRISHSKLWKQSDMARVNLLSHRNPLSLAVFIWFLYLTMAVCLILCFAGDTVCTEITLTFFALLPLNP